MRESVETIVFSKDTKTAVLIECVKKSFTDLLKAESRTIAREVHEVTISGMYMSYFLPNIENVKEVKLHIEYNRNLRDPKSILEEDHPRFDLILHRPGSNEDNLIHWEFKKSLRKDMDVKILSNQFKKDQDRLTKTTSDDYKLRKGDLSGRILGQFSLGVFCCFLPKNPKHVFLVFYEKGKVLTTESGLYGFDCNKNFVLIHKM